MSQSDDARSDSHAKALISLDNPACAPLIANQPAAPGGATGAGALHPPAPRDQASVRPGEGGAGFGAAPSGAPLPVTGIALLGIYAENEPSPAAGEGAGHRDRAAGAARHQSAAFGGPGRWQGDGTTRQHPFRARVAFDILAERVRQVHDEGYGPEHDDTHTDGALATAAACFALSSVAERHLGPRRRVLVEAGALIVAEIERLDRAAAKATS